MGLRLRLRLHHCLSVLRGGQQCVAFTFSSPKRPGLAIQAAYLCLALCLVSRQAS